MRPRARAAENPVEFHLNATIYELRQAKEEVRNLKGVPDALRDKALGALDAGISTTKKCLVEDLGVKEKYIAPDKSPYPADETNKHMRHAIREIKEAKDLLRSAKGISEEHRDAALASMNKAVEVLKDVLEAAK